MTFEFKPKYLIGIGVALFFLILDFVLFFDFTIMKPSARWFIPMIIISFTISTVQFWMDFLSERTRQKKVELKFLDFVRNLESTVRSGVPIPQAIIQSSQKDYSELNPYLNKLANQIQLGIPVHKALDTFAIDTENKVIKRAIAIVIEAEASGGDIESVLGSVTDSVLSVKKLQEERKSGAYSQIVQGYIIYFVFIAIMLILQLKLFPKLTQMGASGAGQTLNVLGAGLASGASETNLDFLFFVLIMIQGLFAGIMIGKFSEGTIKDGIIHSAILMTVAALIITTAKGGI
ncbi:MAG: type II secretion system F family protein [archaeon]